MLCVCVAHVVEKAVRDARVAESQAERVAQARVRAARLTDLPFLLAGAAEQGAIAARGDAMVNNNDFLTCRCVMKYVVSSWGAALSLSALSARLIARHDPSALSKRECTPPIRELEVS